LTCSCARTAENSTELLRQREHWWCRRTDGLISVPARPQPGFSSRACGGANARFGHRNKRSVVYSHHQSPARRGEEARSNSKKPSVKSADVPVSTNASLEGLRQEWRRLYHCEPPRLSRDLLVRGIGYRLQELKYGGLSNSTRRKLKTLAKMLRTEGRVASGPGLSLKPGAHSEGVAWTHSYRDGDGRRLRICRHDLCVPHQNRQGDRRHPLVWSALLRACARWSPPHKQGRR
jgi:hypothetical protein